MRVAGVILCGGKSSRMGKPKAWLPVGDELMLPRVVRIVREAVGPVVVVAAPGQDVPPQPAGVEVVRDEVEGRGPLGGLAAGLAALEGATDAVYLSSCDVPLLKPEFVRLVVGALSGPPPAPSLEGGGELRSRLLCVRGRAGRVARVHPLPPGRGLGGGLAHIAVPRADGRLHPLAAAYRVGVLPRVRELLAANRFRMTDFLDTVTTAVIEAEELAAVDPRLHSLRNVNTPDEYEAALRALNTPPGE